jgi:2-polyprenyl-3-methyl-5-hydroxy-6-metoxy-1,4-benzoquinol methylase
LTLGAEGAMNRKQRRAAQSGLPAAGKRTPRVNEPEPTSAQGHNELACQLLLQGRLDEAATHFARALTLMPELFEEYPHVVATLLKVNPAIRAGFARAASAWPRDVPAKEVLGPSGIAAIARDPMLRAMLESGTVRDLNLERYLTALRRIILALASDVAKSGDAVKHHVLAFACALAKQCFLNEYVFASKPEESDAVARLKDMLSAALTARRPVSPLLCAAVAAYLPLSQVDGSRLLLDRALPEPVRGVLAQQLIEPEEEQRYRETIARLTKIENDVSLSVKQQYEENPYPRWVAAVSDRGALPVTEYLRRQFPLASIRDVQNDGKIDVVVAGCGTGQQSIVTARRFAGASVLAVDLSLASLGYAKRMSRLFGADNIEYAQADLLELASLGRTFDVIEASGVLHHLAEPIEGWRVLLSLLRPGGCMHVGLYSKIARAQIRAARAYLAEKGAKPSPGDIRRWRHELVSTPMRSVAQYADYFSLSECRDLLFHVQEHNLTIAEIAAFLDEHNLQFIGFELPPAILASYRLRFPDDHAMADLASWQAFETENPATFASMYQFWIQKS